MIAKTRASRRCLILSIIIACPLVLALTADAQKTSPDAWVMKKLHALTGRLLAESYSAKPVGDIGLTGYNVEELSLQQPVEVEIKGRKASVNRFLDSSSLSVNALGGEVSQTGLAAYGLCGGLSHCLPTEIDARQPHTAPSISVSRAGLTQLLLGWDTASATYSEELPEGRRDASSFTAFQFRAAVNYGE